MYSKRRLIALIAFLFVIGVLYWLWHDVVSFDHVVQQENRLRDWIATNPLLGFAAGLGVYVLLSLIPGTAGKAFVFGWLYGFWPALVIVDCGLTVAALVTFAFSRYLFLDMVEAKFAAAHKRLVDALEREGAFYLLTLRLIHAPYTLLNYLAGATGVRMRTFWWTTQVGLLPGTAVCVLVGSRLPSLEELKDRGLWSLLDPLLVAGLALTALLPVAVRLGLAGWRRFKKPQEA